MYFSSEHAELFYSILKWPNAFENIIFLCEDKF